MNGGAEFARRLRHLDVRNSAFALTRAHKPVRVLGLRKKRKLSRNGLVRAIVKPHPVDVTILGFVDDGGFAVAHDVFEDGK
jgi:hypothetical protein